MAAFTRGFPGDWSEGALEEAVVDDVALVVFAFDDPVAGIGFALAGVGEDEGGVEALGSVYQKGSTSTEGVHLTLLSASFCRLIYFSTTFVKKA